VPSKRVGARSSILAAAGYLLSVGEDFEGGIATTAKEDSDGHKEREVGIEHESIFFDMR
jgi:hypothetical protein